MNVGVRAAAVAVDEVVAGLVVDVVGIDVVGVDGSPNPVRSNGAGSTSSTLRSVGSPAAR